MHVIKIIHNPILTGDDGNLSTTKNQWAKCGGISLSKRNLQKLTGGKELSDLYINAFKAILKSQFDSIGGLQSKLSQQSKFALSHKKENNLQAINISIIKCQALGSAGKLTVAVLFCMILHTLH